MWHPGSWMGILYTLIFISEVIIAQTCGGYQLQLVHFVIVALRLQ